ncbi:MAG: Rieske (2Fe-2S) protein [Xanthobacteraceae bacterium]
MTGPGRWLTMRAKAWGEIMVELFVCKAGEIKDGDVRIVAANDVEVGVYCRGGKYYAYRNQCLHQGGPACEGVMLPKVEDVFGKDHVLLGQRFDEGEIHIVCPWHGWEYKLTTGECAPDPKLKLKRHEVVQREGGIYVVI